MAISDLVKTCDQMIALAQPFIKAKDAIEELSTLEAYKKELKAQVEDLKIQRQNTEIQLADALADVAKLRQTRESEIFAIEADFKQKERQLHAEFADKSEAVTKDFDRLKNRQDGLLKSIEGLEHDLNTKRSEKQSLIADIEELEENKRKLSKDKEEEVLSNG